MPLAAGDRLVLFTDGLTEARNAADEEYFELLQPAPGGQGAGHYGAQLGDPRTYGLTFRFAF